MIYFYQQEELGGKNMMVCVLENFASSKFHFIKKSVQNYTKLQGDYSLQILLNYTITKMIFWAGIFHLVSCYRCM